MLAKYAIGNIVYYVSDIDRTEAFYRDTLGLSVDRIPGDGPEHGGDFLIAHTAGGTDLIFFKNLDAKSGQSPIIVFTLAEGGIDAIVSNLAKKGVTIVTPLSEAPGGWSADLADPDGHVFSVYQSEEIPR
jgi:predicted enzyme related to lactoylglutathione lyase